MVHCSTAKRNKTEKRKKRKIQEYPHTVQTYSNCRCISRGLYNHIHNKQDERERLAYRITTVSLTKHFQRNMCHLSNPIKVGWFARESHPLHSLCDWTCYNWIIANNSGLISVDFIFGGGVGFRSTSDAEGLVYNDRIVAGVSLQQGVIRTMD